MNCPKCKKEIPEDYLSHFVARSLCKKCYSFKRARDFAKTCTPMDGGKSFAALGLAARIDPDFKPENIVFSTEEFVELINGERGVDLKPGSIVVFEDLGKAWEDAKKKYERLKNEGR